MNHRVASFVRERQRIAAGLLVCVTLAAAGGCSKESEPKPPASPTPNANATPTTPPDSSTPAPPPVAQVKLLDKAAAKVNGATGGEVKLPDGARVELPAGSVAGDAEVRLLRTSRAAGTESVQPVTDVYRVESVGRFRRGGDMRLTIPLGDAAAALPVESLQVFAVRRGLLFPVPGRIDPAAKVAVVDNPDIALADIPAEPLRFLRADADAFGRSEAEDWLQQVGYTVGKTNGPVIPPDTCVGGLKGTTHAEHGQVFRIILEVDVPCAIVRKIAADLNDAYEIYNRTYTRSDGSAPLEHLSPYCRMPVYIGDYKDAGEYKPWSGTGSMLLSANAAVNKPDELRDTLFHELFHAVQDAYFNMYAAGHQGYWWFEATAEWAGFKSRNVPFAQMVSHELTNYKHLLSLPIEQSAGDPISGGTATYGFALLVDFVERQKPGYVAETLRTANTALSASLYQSLVTAGDLGRTYPQFIAEVLPLAPGGLWLRGRVQTLKDGYRIADRDVGGIGVLSERTRLVNTPDAVLEDRSAIGALRLAPLTTLLYRVQTGNSKDVHSVKINLTVNGKASDKAWVLTQGPATSAGAQAPPVRLDPAGTTIERLGPEVNGVTIAVFNDDPRNDAQFAIRVVVKRKKPSDFEFINLRHKLVTDPQGNSVRLLMGEVRNIGQVAVSNPVIVLTDPAPPQGARPPSASMDDTHRRLPPGGVAPFVMAIPPSIALADGSTPELEVTNIFVDARPQPVETLAFEDAWIGVHWPPPGTNVQVMAELEARLKNTSKQPTTDEVEDITITFYDAAGKVVGVGHNRTSSPDDSIPPHALGGYLRVNTRLIDETFSSYRITARAGDRHRVSVLRSNVRPLVAFKQLELVEDGLREDMELTNTGSIPVWPTYAGMGRIGAVNQGDGTVVPPGGTRRISDAFRKKRQASPAAWFKHE